MGTWGGLLLFYDRNDQTGKGDENHEQLEQFLICNNIHTYHPLPVRTGGKEGSPPEEGDNRLPCYGSARLSKEPYLFYQNVT